MTCCGHTESHTRQQSVSLLSHELYIFVQTLSYDNRSRQALAEYWQCITVACIRLSERLGLFYFAKKTDERPRWLRIIKCKKISVMQTSCWTRLISYSERDSVWAGQLLAPVPFVSGYTTALKTVGTRTLRLIMSRHCFTLVVLVPAPL